MPPSQRRLLFWGALGALLAIVLRLRLPRRSPCRWTSPRSTRGPLDGDVDEEGETRVHDVFVLSAPVAGFMRRIEVEAGDPVVAGETVVAEIEPGDPDAARRAQRSEARAASARPRRARAAAELQSAQAELEFARAELAPQLGERGVASARDLDEAEKAVSHRARRRVETAQRRRCRRAATSTSARAAALLTPRRRARRHATARAPASPYTRR